MIIWIEENITTLGYKTGLFNLNASYSDVSEGDIVAFFLANDSTGLCTGNSLGYNYTFRYARFPQVMFGDSPISVNSYNSTAGAVNESIILCYSCTSSVNTGNCAYL